MKKVILSIAVVALVSSCNNVQNYSVVIQNECSGKKKEDKPCNCGVVQSDNKEFTLSQADWMKAYVGSNYCITNASKW